MVKTTRILIILALSAGLMLGSMGNIFAAEPSLISMLNISGTVVEKSEISNDEGFIKLKTERGLVKVLVTTETKFNVPGKEESTSADIKVGDRIKVVATRTNSSLIANNVTVLPQFVYKPCPLEKARMELPHKQIKKIWLDMRHQQIKRALVHLPSQLVKIWIHLEPQQTELVRIHSLPQPV